MKELIELIKRYLLKEAETLNQITDKPKVKVKKSFDSAQDDKGS